MKPTIHIYYEYNFLIFFFLKMNRGVIIFGLLLFISTFLSQILESLQRTQDIYLTKKKFPNIYSNALLIKSLNVFGSKWFFNSFWTKKKKRSNNFYIFLRWKGSLFNNNIIKFLKKILQLTRCKDHAVIVPFAFDISMWKKLVRTLHLTIGFGDTFGLVFFFNCVRVWGTFSGIDNFIG